MKTSNTARASRHRVAATAAALAGLALMLTGCGGGTSANGTYYIQNVNGTSDLGQLVVDGRSLSHHEYQCDGVYDEPDVTSTGELNEKKTEIVWTVAGEDQRNNRVGTEPITISDNSISINGDVYVRDGSDAGKALLDGFKAACAK